MKIKLTRCPSCHATKAQRSPTAYVYCDFCGVLADFDFQLAISDTRSKLPGPQYEELRARLAPQVEDALKKKDKQRHLALNRTLFEAYVKACPAACSPRVGDPAYRSQYIEHGARTLTEGAFDAEWTAASARQATAMKALKWVTRGTKATCEPAGFWALYETVVEMNVANRSLAKRTGLDQIDPDHDSPVTDQIALSLFVQGWLPYLKKPEVDELMKRAGVAGQYVEATPTSGNATACGGCKAEVTVPQGSKRCVCDGCGHLLRTDVSVSCTQCGAPMLMPAERSTFQCPFCSTELRTMAWTAAHVHGG